ncbi:MAG: nicotinate phosphoribosyltransferase [Rubripirellula sp.]
MLPQTDGNSLSLLTDLYQLTMGYGYWRNRMHTRQSVFHLFFRNCPFQGQYAIAAGLGPAIEWLQNFCVDDEDVQYLRTLTGNDGRPLFAEDFLDAISGLKLSVDVDAIPEGTLVFAHEPLLRLTGPLWQCQWIETALLNIVNFQTLIATKAARVCDAACGEPVLEFGLRRAQGIDGAVSASRAAYLGGCDSTSNVLAGRLLGIPVKGTHAHSWVMSFDDEVSAFEAYANAMPNNCVFLVDTYDTIEGVKNAIGVGRRLRDSGHKMVGVRLDSGDLAQLSIEARRLLDEAGFPDAMIVASNDLDETEIARLKSQGAKIAVWGVGTNLVTARDQPALGGVYKLAAIQDDNGTWQPRIKLSELPIKTSTPGVQQVRRYFRGDELAGDIIYSELLGEPDQPQSQSFASPVLAIELTDTTSHEDLLIPILRDGKLVSRQPTLKEIRAHACSQRSRLPSATRRLSDAETYAVGLEERLARQKSAMIADHNARTER